MLRPPSWIHTRYPAPAGFPESPRDRARSAATNEIRDAGTIPHAAQSFCHSGSDLNTHDGTEFRFTALHHAARVGQSEITSWLLDSKASPHATDATGATPLDIAMMQGFGDVCLILQHAAGAHAESVGTTAPLPPMRHAPPGALGNLALSSITQPYGAGHPRSGSPLNHRGRVPFHAGPFHPGGAPPMGIRSPMYAGGPGFHPGPPSVADGAGRSLYAPHAMNPHASQHFGQSNKNHQDGIDAARGFIKEAKEKVQKAEPARPLNGAEELRLMLRSAQLERCMSLFAKQGITSLETLTGLHKFMAADQFADVLENCGIAAADTSGLVSALSSKPSAATAPSAEAESVVYKMVKDEFTGANKNKNKNSAKQEEKPVVQVAPATVAAASPPSPPRVSRMPDLSELTTEEIKYYLEQLFKIGDVNGDGVLSPEEFEAVLQKSGFNLDHSVILQIVASADLNGDGEIDFDEFLPAMMKLGETMHDELFGKKSNNFDKSLAEQRFKLKKVKPSEPAFAAGAVLGDIQKGDFKLKRAQTSPKSFAAGDMLSDIKKGGFKLKEADVKVKSSRPDMLDDVKRKNFNLKRAATSPPAFAASAVLNDIKNKDFELKKIGKEAHEYTYKQTMPIELSKRVSIAVDELFWLLDTDKNGTVELDELLAVHGGDEDHLFGRMDANDDGCITRDEMDSFFLTVEYCRGTPTVELLIQYLRTNALSLASEMPLTLLPVSQLLLADVKAMKPASVATSSGKLSAEQEKRAASVFAETDVDNNGKLSKEEITSYWGTSLMELFADVDANYDGVVTLNEWLFFFKNMLLTEGDSVVEFALRYFEAGVATHEAMKAQLAAYEFDEEVTGIMGDLSEYREVMSIACAVDNTVEMTSSKPAVVEFEMTSSAPIQQSLDKVFAHSEAECCLDDKQLASIDELFTLLDTDDDGELDIHEIKSVHGGDSNDLFGRIDTNNDGALSLDEFRAFFNKLAHSKGTNSVGLMVEYLRLNARAVAQEEPITVLPLCQLLLNDVDAAKPASVASPNACINDAQSQRIGELFTAIDLDRSGTVTTGELAAVWGGDAASLFSALDADSNGSVSLHEWFNYFETLVKEEGVRVADFAIAYFERAERTQRAMTFSLTNLKPTPEAKELVARVVAKDCNHLHPAEPVTAYMQQAKIKSIFELLDTDGSGEIDMSELASVHGGDSDQLFSNIDSNEDGVISLEELQSFFSQIAHSQGATSLDLLIQYFRLNALAGVHGRAITILPVCQLLLNDFNAGKPAATLSPHAVLSDSQSQRIAALFDHVDANKNGSVDMSELSAVWGGDAAGTFDLLDLNNSGAVSLHEWLQFFAKTLRMEGPNVVEFAIQYFERTVQVHSAMATTLDNLEPKGRAAEMPAPASPAEVTAAPTRTVPGSEAEEVTVQQTAQAAATAKALSSEGSLSAETLSIVDALFNMMDLDESGDLDIAEVESCHGGDADGLFRHIDTNNDGMLSLDEFRAFFGKLSHSKGSNSAALMAEYLRLNLQAAAREEPITVLPVCQLLLSDFDAAKPAAVASPDTFLTDPQCFEIAELFNAVDADQDGSISKEELAAVWGGDASGLFDNLDEDHNGKVSSNEWESFFGSLLAQEGVAVLKFAMKYFARAVTTQEAIAFTLAQLAPVDV